MKRMMLLALLLATGGAATADDGGLHQYVIERDIPGAAELSADELQAISEKSRSVLEALGADIEWSHSYVAEDKFYCVYRARSADLIRKHAEMGGFPADRILRVSTVIDPSTAD